MADLHESPLESTEELSNSLVLNQKDFISWLIEWLKEGRQARPVIIGRYTVGAVLYEANGERTITLILDQKVSN